MNEDSTTKLQGFFGDEGERVLGPRQTVGRYQLGEEIGRGGMAVVYRALDPDLGRDVAIKILREGSSERLRREAMAAAKLQHPNVVTVHEVGPDYIVMELVKGRTLAAAALELDLRRRLEVLHAVACAVAFAHENGVIHRDLKPENVIIEPGGRTVLTDFGLAKSVGASDLTRTGAAMGTPHYMSPEQVRGDAERIGPPSDIWALGVILYELTTGKRPFDAGSLHAVYAAIVQADPPAMDKIVGGKYGALGAIAARAMESEPQRRYASAAAFADDLRRYLDGEPLSVRPLGPAGRLLRRVRRRPAPWALGVTVVLAAGLILFFAYTGRAARERVVEAVRDQARISLQAALELRRAGATERMQQFVAPLEAAYREALERAPGLPEIDYLMGRMHRALLDDATALGYQQQALAKAPRYAPALYERALLLSLLHGRALEAAAAYMESTPGDPPNRARLEQVKPDLVQRAREAAQAWQAYFAVLPTGEKEPPAARLGRGFALLLGAEADKLGDARKAIESALRADPMLEEGWEALGRVVFFDRLERKASAERLHNEREALLTQRIAADRGYWRHYLDRGQIRWQRGSLRRFGGLNPLDDYDAAADDFSSVIELAPSNAEGWFWRGRMGVYRALWRIENDLDPAPLIQPAEKDLTRALELDPTSATALTARGLLWFHSGFYLVTHGATNGRAAVEVLRAAERDLGEALRNHPEGERYGWRARTRAYLGTALAEVGEEDPMPVFAAGAKDAEESVAANPDDPWRLSWVCALFTQRALYLIGRGEDPTADLERAERYVTHAVEVSRSHVESWRHRGMVHYHRAEWLQSRGKMKDARLSYAAASVDLHQALSLNAVFEKLVGPQAREARRKAQGLDGDRQHAAARSAP